jgi:hypothetical protein
MVKIGKAKELVNIAIYFFLGLHHIKPEKPPALYEEHPVFKPLCFLFFFISRIRVERPIAKMWIRIRKRIQLFSSVALCSVVEPEPEP